MSDNNKKVLDNLTARMRAKYDNFEYYAEQKVLDEKAAERGVSSEEIRNSYLRLGEVISLVDQEFIKEISNDFNSLSPDERIALYQHIIAVAEDELTDAYSGLDAVRCLAQLLLIQLVKQVVPK